MGNIFISYRRGDSIATAGRLRDKLVQVFGRSRVFVDVDDIPHGRDFVKILEGKVAECDVLLAVIGPHWLSALDDAGRRRLDDKHDFVGIEVASALARDTIAVIPILVDGARMPTADELPEHLKPLARRNAIELRNTQFGSDAERLIRSIKVATGESGLPWTKVAAATVALVVLAGGAYLGWPSLEAMLKSAPATAVQPPAKTATSDQRQPPATPAASAPARPAAVVAPGNIKADVAAALARLQDLMRPAAGRVSVGLKGGNRVKLGEQVVFEVISKLAGRLILIDLNAAGEVLQIFPNSYVPGDLVAAIPADRTITVPGAGYGFSGFKAVEPAGKGRLLAVVQPDGIAGDRLPLVQAQISKGFEPVQAPGAYLDQLAQLVARSAGTNNSAGAADWAFTVTEYEIVR